MTSAHRAFVETYSKIHKQQNEAVKERMKKYNLAQKERYDKQRKVPVQYAPNEAVIVDMTPRMVGNKRKLRINKHRGVIIDKIGDNAYVVKLDDTNKYMPVNVSQIYRLSVKPSNQSILPSMKKHNANVKKLSKRSIQRRRQRKATLKTKRAND